MQPPYTIRYTGPAWLFRRTWQVDRIVYGRPKADSTSGDKILLVLHNFKVKENAAFWGLVHTSNLPFFT